MTSAIRYIAAVWVVLTMLSGCSTAKLSVADEQMARGEFYDASRTYRKVYNSLRSREERPQRGMVAYRMGLCYRRLNMSARAASAFKNALRYEYPDSTAWLYMGHALQSEGNYKEAIDAFQQFLDRINDGADMTPHERVAMDMACNGIAGCREALRNKDSRSRYIVKSAKVFNTRRADFAPMYFDQDIIYFTTTNEKVTGSLRSEITGMKKSDIWMSRKNERGEWMRPEPVEGGVNTVHDEGVVSFSPDGTTMYLTRARREPDADTGVEICTSQRSDAQWSAPVRFEITADTLSNFAHPAVSPDGNWLYFTSDMPGGYGGYDLWRVNLKERAGTLENLGEWINTAGNEVFPYVRADSVIYFSSDGHTGLGGLDIYRAEHTPSGGWNVTNMDKPVNSSADDFGITFGTGESGYFSSNRGDARGYDHIYSFVLPDLRITISGLVIDRDDEPVPNSVIRIVGNDGSNQKAAGRDDGSFSFPLRRGVKYVMLAGAPGYLNARQEFESDIAEEDAEYNVDFILASINKPNVVDNIFYDFDKATLRPESKMALDSMAQVLRDNPNISIEMGAHTDRKGSVEYNLRLSQRRAQSVIDYLVEAGISADRLRPQGYGKSQPKTITKRLARQFPQFGEGQELTPEFIDTLDPGDQEVADQINRRTEFRVLSVDFR